MFAEYIVGVGNEKGSCNLKYSTRLCQKLIAEALISAGLGTIDKNKPLLDIINPGNIVLLKPNWVVHKNYSGFGTESLITNRSFIEAVLIEVFKCKPNKVIIGDAPIQGCDFSKIATREWINKLQATYSISLELVDFRQTIMESSPANKNQLVSTQNKNRKEEDYLLFDLGPSSSLEDISGSSGNFRVVMYDHRKLNKKHRKGIHQYLIAKEIFEADVIINMPKLKTHKKAGFTGALKNIVGIIGSKDYLPHHRVGGSVIGGDNYSGFSILKRISEYFTDMANIYMGKIPYNRYFKIAGFFSRIANKIGSKSDFEGGWYGNDTTWRMVLDLNKLILYGNKDGKLNPTPLRRVYSITDAIIAGDTEGPLSVEPVNLGLVTFSSSSVFADMVHATLMCFDWRKIPCVRESFILNTFSIVQHSPEECRVIVNGQEIQLDELAQKYGKPFRTPKFWKGHIEIN